MVKLTIRPMNEAAETYLDAIRERIEKDSLVFAWVYAGGLKRAQNPKEWVFDVEPRLPRFYEAGFILLFLTFILNSAYPALWIALLGYLPGALLTLTGVFWLDSFYKLFFYLGARKCGAEVRFS